MGTQTLNVSRTEEKLSYELKILRVVSKNKHIKIKRELIRTQMIDKRSSKEGPVGYTYLS